VFFQSQQTIQLSGTTITVDSSDTLEVVSSTSLVPAFRSSVYDSTTGKVVLAYTQANGASQGDDAGDGYANVITIGGTPNLTSENYIGISSSGVSDGQVVTVHTQGMVDDNQTGLIAGQTYYVQTNGTISTTAGSPSVIAGTAISATELIVKG
jgi:hypothetical protein